jgi:4-hydroxy-tetrahydrodipicolinate reductase
MSESSIAIIGHGKMGRAIAEVAKDSGIPIAAIIDEGTPITRESLAGAAVAIEFTEPSAAIANIKACVQAGCPVVVGTTGWYDQLESLSTFVTSSGGTMLWAANFSLGVNIFAELLRYAGELFSRVPNFDAHLVESHHTAKKDAPSGTAIVLEKAVSSTLGRSVPITSIRVGSVPGTHELIFDAKYDQITLTHTARDRRVFAEGAVAAARWLIGRKGVFTIADMLGAPSVSSGAQ